MPVCDVQHGEGGRKILGESLSHAQVQLDVPRQVTGWLPAAVRCSRLDGHIRGGKCLHGQVRIEPDIRRIALVVIEREIPSGWAEIREAAIDRAVSVGRLIRISQVSLPHTPELGRPDGEFVALYQRTVDGQGQEGVRIADVVVIEEVLRLGMEMIDIDYPSVDRNREAGLIFLIAFAVQRQEAQIIVLGESKQWATQSGERRRLIVLSPKSAQDPVELRQP